MCRHDLEMKLPSEVCATYVHRPDIDLSGRCFRCSLWPCAHTPSPPCQIPAEPSAASRDTVWDGGGGGGGECVCGG